MNRVDQYVRGLDWLANGATLLAVAACYGTTLAIAGLSSLGVAVALNEDIWAGVISSLALLALAGILLGYTCHRKMGPLALATPGAGLVLWAMFGHYHWLIELGGLAALAIAAGWDWRLKSSSRRKETRYARRSA